MKRGTGLWGAIVVLAVVVSAFFWAAGSEEAGAYKVGANSEQDASLFNTTEQNEVTNLSWVDRIHNEIHFDININKNEADVADVTYDNISIPRKSDITPLDANNNRIEDSLELKASNVSIARVDVIVLYNRSVDLDVIDYSSIGAEIKYDYSIINATAITIPCNRLYELSTIQDIKMVYEDHEVHAYLDSSVPVIKADTARTTYNVTGSNVTIAVIDTGIDDAHESLDDMDDNPATNDPKVIGFKDFVNFYPDPYDDHGHGTHCAGIAAGTGGSSVYKGVAPDAKLVGVKVLNARGSGSESTVIAGIDWTVQNKDDYGIKIISMSLGRDYNNDGTTPMALACDAAVDAGIVVAVAAGNAGMWGSKTVGDPACAKKVITVGAIDDDMDIAYFSSRGPTADGRIKPEVCAVGVDVTSAEAETGNGYTPHSGTSMSTPHVAGVAALMLEYNPNLAPLEVREILMDTAVDRGVMGPDNDYGWGVVDSMLALLLSVPQEHDIKVSLPFIPEYVKINKSLPINATIFNKGLNNETNITVQLLINGSINETKIISLDSGENCSVNFTWTPYAEGSYNVSVYAEPLPGENITINNLASRGINVLSNIYLIGYDTTHGERPSSWYIDIIDDIKSKGFIVSDIISGPITLSLLNNYDAIWIDERGGSWSADEKSALVTFVQSGGGLFVEGDEMGDPTIVNVFNISYRGIVGYPGESTDISMHSITRGVSSIYFSPVNSLNVYPPAIDVARDVEGNKMIGVRRYGNGKVVVISDEVLYYIYRADNKILGENIFRWITLPPQAHDIEVLIDAPSIVEVNVSTQINAVIANTGLNNETDVIIDFIINGTVLESKTIAFIQNGTDTTISFNWTPTAVGWYNISVYAIPVPGEDYVVNNLATCSVHVPEAVLTDVYADYGIDLDTDGLYNYLAIDVGVNVGEAGYYYLYGNLETLNGFYITSVSNNTYLSVGKQNITLLFNGIDIRRVDLNGPYTLSNLRLRDNYWNTLDRRLKAYNTSFYDSKEFQLPKAMFTDVYNDTGVDTDNDTYYNYLSIDIGVNVSESGYYRWYGELYDGYGRNIAYEGNSSYLENGTQTIRLNFKGPEIYGHKVDGPYYLKYLRLYDADHIKQDSRHDAYTTSAYNYVEFRPPAIFNDVYSDYGEDTDGDGLNNSLVINVGVNVTKAGRYQVSGSLYESFLIPIHPIPKCQNEGNQERESLYENATTYRSRRAVSASNTTYLQEGDQIVQLRFDGIKFRQNKYNGTYDLRYLSLYNAAYTYPVPPPVVPPIPIPMPTPVPGVEKSEVTEDTNNFSVQYREQLDYRYYAYTTGYYVWPGWQKPPAEFNDIYSDYGEDTDVPPDGFNNSLVINIGVNVTKAGRYQVSGELHENGTWHYITGASNASYLSEGNQTVQLRFDGIRIRQNKYNGTYDLRYLRLYNVTYSYPVPVPRPGGGGGGGGATSPIPISERELEKEIGKGEISPENVSAIYWEEFDYRRYAYTTKYYNWTEFQPPPAEFAFGFNDYGLDTNNNSLYDYLVIEKEIEVRKAGNYSLSGWLEAPSGKWSDSDSNYTYLDIGLHNVTLKFYGPSIYLSGESGKFNVYMDLYDRDNGRRLGWATNTTPYYNYTDFDKPPAEFTGNFSDYGVDTDIDTFYNYLAIEAEINVTKAGEYELSGSLQYYNEEKGYWGWEWIDGDSNRTYLDAGIHNITLQFDGIRIYNTKYNGSFRTWLNLYETEEWHRIDEMEYFTHFYNYTDFQRPPAEFNEVYTDNGTDTDGDGLYNNLTIDIGVNVRNAGYYEVEGRLYDICGNYIVRAKNSTYLDTGNQAVKLDFNGMKIRQNGVNGIFQLKYLSLYNTSDWVQLDYIDDAYTTSYYNYTDFQTIPPCYTYTKEYVTYDWDAISIPDKNWTGCDDCSYNYVLPWNFTFFCENHSSIQISTNGLITFPPDTSSHCCSPDLEYTVAIAPFWGDLSQACGQGTNISVQDKGDRVVVIWYTGTCGGECLNKDLFEVILYENGNIRFNYNYLNNIPYSVGAGISNAIVYYTNTWGNGISVVYSPINETEPSTTFDTGSGTYPSISGMHNGTITPNQTIIATKLYTYPCEGTGGHTEYARIWNSTWNATATWNGYVDDWHNISFDKPVVLLPNKTYNYTIRTGSYPQIIHARSKPVTGGLINCTTFTDANGKNYDDWIPAIRLYHN